LFKEDGSFLIYAGTPKVIMEVSKCCRAYVEYLDDDRPRCIKCHKVCKVLIYEKNKGQVRGRGGDSFMAPVREPKKDTRSSDK